MKNILLSLTLITACAVNAQAAFTYDCEVTSGSYTDLTLEIDSELVTVTPGDLSEASVFTAQLDKTYKPRGAPKLRFVGEEKGNSRDVVVSERMASGAPQGYLQIRGNEDSYWSADFDCDLK